MVITVYTIDRQTTISFAEERIRVKGEPPRDVVAVCIGNMSYDIDAMEFGKLAHAFNPIYQMEPLK